MNTLHRIKQFIDFKGITTQKFEKEVGFSNGAFATQLKNNRTIGVDKLENILSKYPELNSEWVLTGAGGMLKTISKVNVTKENSNNNGNIISNKPNVKEKLPFYNDSVNDAGSLYKEKTRKIPFYDCVSINGISSVADLTAISQPSEYIDPGDLFRDADAGMRTYEDSMVEYPSGCAIFLKEVHNKELIVYGNDYVIETSEYRVTKRLQRSLKEGYWTLASTNMETWHSGPLQGRLIHEPFDVNIDWVVRLFKVLGVTTRTGSSKILMNNQ